MNPLTTLTLRISLLLMTSSAFAQPPLPEGTGSGGVLRVMSFNIRNSGARDGANEWRYRKEFFVSTVRNFDPDLLGTQEVLADQFDDLRELFPDYTLVGIARDDGLRKGEWAAILFRTKRFEKLEAGDFWLSEHPEQTGSKSWDAAAIRICTWVKLRDRVSGRQLLLANTHFDHEGAVARVEAAKLLQARLPTLAKGIAVMLMGDFNCTETDEAYRVLVHSNPDRGVALFDSYREVHPTRSDDEATFHAFKGTITGSRIDWILHTREWKPVSAEIIRSRGDRYPSDHYPVTAVFQQAGKNDTTEKAP